MKMLAIALVGLVLSGCTVHAHSDRDYRRDPYTDNRRTLYLLERERRLQQLRPPVHRPVAPVCGYYAKPYRDIRGNIVYGWECR